MKAIDMQGFIKTNGSATAGFTIDGNEDSDGISSFVEMLGNVLGQIMPEHSSQMTLQGIEQNATTVVQNTANQVIDNQLLSLSSFETMEELSDAMVENQEGLVDLTEITTLELKNMQGQISTEMHLWSPLKKMTETMAQQETTMSQQTGGILDEASLIQKVTNYQEIADNNNQNIDDFSFYGNRNQKNGESLQQENSFLNASSIGATVTEQQQVIQNRFAGASQNDASSLLEQKVVEQVVEKVQVQFDNKSQEFTMKLQPDGLGEIMVKLSIQDNLMTIHLLSDSKLTRSILFKHADELLHTLQNQQATLQQIEVEYVSDKESYLQNRDQQHSRQQNQQQNQQHSWQETEELADNFQDMLFKQQLDEVTK